MIYLIVMPSIYFNIILLIVNKRYLLDKIVEINYTINKIGIIILKFFVIIDD